MLGRRKERQEKKEKKSLLTGQTRCTNQPFGRHQFYRYLPNNQKLTFQVPGVQVDAKRSDARDIWLRINRRSAGLYKCQVSVEDSFNSVSAERRLEVLLEPSSGLQSPPAPTSSGGGGATSGQSESAWPWAGASARPRLQIPAHNNNKQTMQQAVRGQASQVYALGSGGGGARSSAAASSSASPSSAAHSQSWLFGKTITADNHRHLALLSPFVVLLLELRRALVRPSHW